MTSRISRQRLALSLGVLGLLLVGVLSFGLASSWPQLVGPNRDYNKLPAADAFERVFGQKPPSGVADLTVAGKISFSESNVWLRFRADEATTSHLLKEWKPDEPWTADEMWWTLPDLVQRYDLERRVHCSEVGKLKQAKYYRLERPGGNTSVAIDHARHLVYAFYWSQ